MIGEIKVSADYCFGPEPLRLQQLGKVNFVFAPNGSGKTTLSNALANQPVDSAVRETWDVAPTDLSIRVFNEAYRSDVLGEYVNGIFTMGEESREANEAIDELQAEKRLRAAERKKWKEKIGSDSGEDGPTGLLGELLNELETARSAAFQSHKTIPSAAREVVFHGFRRSIDKFGDQALELFAPDVPAPGSVTWADLEARAKSLTGDQGTRDLLPEVAVTSLITAADTSALLESHSSGGAGEFSELIARLDHEDWVSEGRKHLNNAGGVCPFCQLTTPDDLETRLAEHFAAGFDDALARATAIAAKVALATSTLGGQLDALENAVSIDPEVDQDTFDAAVTAVRTATSLLGARVKEKLRHPTRSLGVADVDVVTSELTELVADANLKITNHNDIVQNSRKERERLVSDGWALFLSEGEVARVLKRFRGIKDSKEQEIAKLQAEIDASIAADDDADEKITELRNAISNTAEIAERINALLHAMGFHRFKIDVVDSVTGGYRIVREDGSAAVSSLSEGERSFLCFVYYWESLSGSLTSGGNREDVVAVIDDPISSLDSDTLFIVAAYLREAARSAIEGTSNIRQLIVLTHNTQFHHEAAYTSNRSSSRDRRHFRLVKSTSGYSTVADDGSMNKIRGTYPLLWESVVEAARTNDESNLVRVGVVNVVRRIIEGYFKTIGQVSDYVRPLGLAPADERVVQMLHIWASAGSHTIADDIDQTVDVEGTKQFLQLLRRYFDLVDHSSHFEMMVKSCGGEDLLAEGGVLARQANRAATV